ncbi:MAG: TonB-dependent receptor [Myxococcota bacterium]
MILTTGPPALAQEEEEERKVRTSTTTAPDAGQASSTVTREELTLRQPRSAPDALGYEPGVFVQQTAHSQGSAFIRGRTGQQTVLLFDDVRLNNALFRQGPNQYFFTLDARTIQQIDVVRGSASTRYGSDAIGGVLHARPLEPTFSGGDGFSMRPGIMARHATADAEIGGRASVDAQLGDRIGIFAGLGARAVDQLQSGGVVISPRDGSLPEVPRFAEDGRTQLGTGFDEITGDARVVAPLSSTARATLAYYDYRQLNAPRTDQCPPALAPFDECLTYDEQFRTLIYGALDADFGALAEEARVVLSWQRQHERRSAVRPSSSVFNGGRDDVFTYGLKWTGTTERVRLGARATGLVRWGADVYRDDVSSLGWITFTDLDVTRIRSRGQYLDGSSYTWSGAFAEAEARLFDQVTLRAGGRASLLSAFAPADPESGTEGVDQTWTPRTGNVNAEWWVDERWTLLAAIDGAFRAPNLDDLTSRQRTGPGYQLENADLEPERGETYEVGARMGAKGLQLDVWVFASRLEDAIARTTRNADVCAQADDLCRNATSRLQLINLRGTSRIFGAEGSAKYAFKAPVTLAATVSYAWGDGPAPGTRASEDETAQEREPLSRIPPLHGTTEVLWRPTVRGVTGLYLGAGLRWATTQDRLALQDQADVRIPLGGTPGFAVVDARAGWRFDKYGTVSVVGENLGDAAYRYHGSSVNGPGRGLIVALNLNL